MIHTYNLIHVVNVISLIFEFVIVEFTTYIIFLFESFRMPDRVHSKSPPLTNVKGAKFPPHAKNKKLKSHPMILKFIKIISTLVLPILFAIGGYYMHLNFYKLPSMVRTASTLPRVLENGKLLFLCVEILSSYRIIEVFQIIS